MNLTGSLYGLRQSGVSHGDVFTSPRVVCFMLDLIGYTSDKDLSEYTILEPSFGYGDFLIEIQHRIIQSAKKYNFDATIVMTNNVEGCEIDSEKYNRCVETLRVAMPTFRPSKLKNEDFLFSNWTEKFDFIIGNPPYIRYENIPEEARAIYKARFSTFHYRCDLYVLFYEHSLSNLADSGRHCFICSNRWLKNEYGKKLRALITMSYKLEYIVDIEGLEAFKESVLAYPSITLISQARVDNIVKTSTIRDLDDLILPLCGDEHHIQDFENWDNLFINDEVEGLSTIEEQGFNVGIGVATGADKLYISVELKDKVENELLLPIVNAKDLTGNKFNPKGLYLLNPYDSDGNLIDLNRFPRAKQYLEEYKPVLERRHIVRNGRAWYSLIDKIKPQLVRQPKILLPDISGNDVVFIDYGLYYPAHNIYFIIGNTLRELTILSAILMSKFVRSQIEGISNKMNGGLPRWQSQSIKRIKIPLIAAISPEICNELICAYNKRNIAEIDTIVKEVVNRQSHREKIRSKSKVPQSLFDYDFSGHIG
ncbi:MAG: Eco57I restriction-modification methylase domain-containing protein [Muribaculaceae bacterium]|nr:Eco57I restriction-modification methylase domain-containing protein [Muribaculaceae bacterium]